VGAPTVEEVLDPLVSVCPSFVAVWNDKATRRWEPNGYDVTGALAEHLTMLLRRGETGEMAAAFGVLDRMLSNAGSAHGELLEIYFIEHLQGEAFLTGDWTFADGFLPWLGPGLKAAWKAAFYRWKTGRGFPPSL
jgi:hypothetical protein